MTNNLLISLIFLGIVLLMCRDFLNSIYPGLFDKLLRIIKKILVLSLKIVFWIIGFLLSKLLKPFMKKELPGRRK